MVRRGGGTQVKHMSGWEVNGRVWFSGEGSETVVCYDSKG